MTRAAGRDLGMFLLVGAGATGTQYAVLAAGTSLLGLSAAVSSGAGYLAGSMVSYAANYVFTFQSEAPHGQALARFYAMVGAAWLITMALMGLMVDWLGWNKWLGQVIATVACLAFNYVVSRQWVFRNPQP